MNDSDMTNAEQRGVELLQAGRAERAPAELFDRIKTAREAAVRSGGGPNVWSRRLLAAAVFLLGNGLVLGAVWSIDRACSDGAPRGGERRHQPHVQHILDEIEAAWQVVEAGPLAAPESQLLDEVANRTPRRSKNG